LRKTPGERFASYGQFIAELEAFVAEDPFADAQGPSTTAPSSRYTHRALPGDTSKTPDSRNQSSSVGSDALGDLFRGKLQETTRTFRKPSLPPGPPPGTVRPAPPGTRPVVRGPVPKPRPAPVQEAPPPAIVKAPRQPSLATGTLIDSNYTVLGPIGAGAMGEVYAVSDSVTGREVALKMLSVEDMRRPGMVRRFQGECSALATVNHEAFPFFAGKGTYQDRDYLLMERVQGIDLKAWMQQYGPMSEADGLQVVLQLAEAMDRAYHACGMVHRDIKPANLMLTRAADGEQLKLIDFGVSTYIDYGDFEDFSAREYHYIDDDSKGKAIGTPAYMSPEQCVGAPPSPLMDIYAIGCTFFHLLTGRTPYQAPNAAMMLMAHLQEAPPTFDGLVDVSPGSVYLLKRCLAKNPRDRFKNYRQVIEAVNSARFSLSTRIRRRAN
jgi:hypothetical protein